MESEERHHFDGHAAQVIGALAGNPDDLLDSKALADWFGVTPAWIERLRARGQGPKFIRIGKRALRYRRGDVLAWLESRAQAFARKRKAV